MINISVINPAVNYQILDSTFKKYCCREASFEKPYTTLLSQADLRKNRLIELSAKACAQFSYYEQPFTFSALSRMDVLNEAELKYYFHDESTLLKQVLGYVQNLCQTELFDKLRSSHYSGLRRVLYFSRLVQQLFIEYPECAYWFKAGFMSHIVTSDIYVNVTDFYDVWREVVKGLLIQMTSPKQAKNIANTYIELVKACLLNTSEGEEGAHLFSAKYFLFHSAANSGL